MTDRADQILIDLDWLDRQAAPVLLADARRGADYRRGHLPGAIHLETHPYVNERTDPEGLAKIEADWARMFGEAGISPEDAVVFYDNGTENWAPRGAFMLRYLGHRRSYVLHGGVSGWLAAGRQLTKEANRRRPAPGVSYPIGQRRRDMVATADEVLAALNNPDIVVLDNREEPEYLGKRRLQWNPRMGRLAGVAFLTWWKLLEGKRRFKEPAEMRRLLFEQGVTPDKEVIIYCQKSHRATNTFVALESLGYPRIRVYPGSFREWSRRKDLPIVR